MELKNITSTKILQYLQNRFSGYDLLAHARYQQDFSYVLAGGSVANTILSLLDGVDYPIRDLDLFTSDSLIPNKQILENHTDFNPGMYVSLTSKDIDLIYTTEEEALDVLAQHPENLLTHIRGGVLRTQKTLVKHLNLDVQQKIAPYMFLEASEKNFKSLPCNIKKVYNLKEASFVNLILTEGLTNQTLAAEGYIYHTSSFFTAKDILMTFDLNCVKAAIDLVTGELVVSNSFLEFLENRIIKIERLACSSSAIVRAIKKALDFKIGVDETLDNIYPIIRSPSLNPIGYLEALIYKDIEVYRNLTHRVVLSNFKSPFTIEFPHKFRQLKKLDRLNKELNLGLQISDNGLIEMHPRKNSYLVSPLEFAYYFLEETPLKSYSDPELAKRLNDYYKVPQGIYYFVNHGEAAI